MTVTHTCACGRDVHALPQIASRWTLAASFCIVFLSHSSVRARCPSNPHISPIVPTTTGITQTLLFFVFDRSAASSWYFISFSSCLSVTLGSQGTATSNMSIRFSSFWVTIASGRLHATFLSVLLEVSTSIVLVPLPNTPHFAAPPACFQGAGRCMPNDFASACTNK